MQQDKCAKCTLYWIGLCEDCLNAQIEKEELNPTQYSPMKEYVPYEQPSSEDVALLKRSQFKVIIGGKK